MTFSLRGRIQTRLFLAATVGAIWTAIITPFLPSPPMGSIGGVGMVPMEMSKFMVPIAVPYNPIPFDYRMTFETLGLMALVGIAWELLYHLLQQFRWDKDWPPLFTLVALVPEGIVLWYVIHLTHVENGTWALTSSGFPMFAIHLATTWVLMWLFMVGPMKVVSLKWRFEGGELV